MKAVFSRWIEKKLLQIPNPMDAIDEPDPEIRVIDYVPTQEDYEKIIEVGMKENIRLDTLRLIGVVRYSGFRVNEVLKWQIEDCFLHPDDGGIPYIKIWISKQNRKLQVERPIRIELYHILKEQIGQRSEGPVWPW